MNAGQDNTMIAIHGSALSKIGDVLIVLQDETIKRMSDATESAEAERDEARRQLTEAQRAIDVLSNTVVAQNNEIKRMSQQREDVAEYRAEIARLTRKIDAYDKADCALNQVLNEGDGVYRP